MRPNKSKQPSKPFTSKASHNEQDVDSGPEYGYHFPEHGAVNGKGNDLAHHFILSCMDLAITFSLCICLLFVDLSKAYDGVVRELLMGIPQNAHHD